MNITYNEAINSVAHMKWVKEKWCDEICYYCKSSAQPIYIKDMTPEEEKILILLISIHNG
jgi:hypothetical protein